MDMSKFALFYIVADPEPPTYVTTVTGDAPSSSLK